MVDRQEPPKARDRAELLTGQGEVKVGIFWRNCKDRRRCGRPHYDRMLINPVLRADYRSQRSGTRG